LHRQHALSGAERIAIELGTFIPLANLIYDAVEGHLTAGRLRGPHYDEVVELDKIFVLNPDPELQWAGVFGAEDNSGGPCVRGFGADLSKRGLMV
jgi:hypothetical protein